MGLLGGKERANGLPIGDAGSRLPGGVGDETNFIPQEKIEAIAQREGELEKRAWQRRSTRSAIIEIESDEQFGQLLAEVTATGHF